MKSVWQRVLAAFLALLMASPTLAAPYVPLSADEGAATSYVRKKGPLVLPPRAARAQKVVFDTPDKQLIHAPDTPLRRFFDSHAADFAAGKLETAKTDILEDIIAMLRSRSFVREMVQDVVDRHAGRALAPRSDTETVRTLLARASDRARQLYEAAGYADPTDPAALQELAALVDQLKHELDRARKLAPDDKLKQGLKALADDVKALGQTLADRLAIPKWATVAEEHAELERLSSTALATTDGLDLLRANLLKEDVKELRRQRGRALAEAITQALVAENYPHVRDLEVAQILEPLFDGASGGAYKPHAERLRDAWIAATGGTQGAPAVHEFRADLVQTVTGRDFFRQVIDQAVDKRLDLFKGSRSPTGALGTAEEKLKTFVETNVRDTHLASFGAGTDTLWTSFVKEVTKDATRVVQAADRSAALDPSQRSRFGADLLEAVKKEMKADAELEGAMTRALAGFSSQLKSSGAADASLGEWKKELETEKVSELFASLSRAASMHRKAKKDLTEAEKALSDVKEPQAERLEDAEAAVRQLGKDLTGLVLDPLEALRRAVSDACGDDPDCVALERAREAQARGEKIEGWDEGEFGKVNGAVSEVRIELHDIETLEKGLEEVKKSIEAYLDAATTDEKKAELASKLLDDTRAFERAVAPADVQAKADALRLELVAHAEKLEQAVRSAREAGKVTAADAQAIRKLTAEVREKAPFLPSFAERWKDAQADGRSTMTSETAFRAKLRAVVETARSLASTQAKVNEAKKPVQAAKDAEDQARQALLDAIDEPFAASNAKRSATERLSLDALKKKLAAVLTEELAKEPAEGAQPPKLSTLLDQALAPQLTRNVTAARNSVAAEFRDTFRGHPSLVTRGEPILEALLRSGPVKFGGPDLGKTAVKTIPRMFNERVRDAPAADRADRAKVLGLLVGVLRDPAVSFLFGSGSGNAATVAAFKAELYNAFHHRIPETLAAEREADYDYWWLTFHPKAVPVGHKRLAGASYIEINFPSSAIPAEQYQRWQQDFIPRRSDHVTNEERRLRVASDVLRDFLDVLDASELGGRFPGVREGIAETLEIFAGPGFLPCRFHRGMSFLYGLATDGSGNAPSWDFDREAWGKSWDDLPKAARARVLDVLEVPRSEGDMLGRQAFEALLTHVNLVEPQTYEPRTTLEHGFCSGQLEREALSSVVARRRTPRPHLPAPASSARSVRSYAAVTSARLERGRLKRELAPEKVFSAESGWRPVRSEKGIATPTSCQQQVVGALAWGHEMRDMRDEIMNGLGTDDTAEKVKTRLSKEVVEWLKQPNWCEATCCTRASLDACGNESINDESLRMLLVEALFERVEETVDERVEDFLELIEQRAETQVPDSRTWLTDREAFEALACLWLDDAGSNAKALECDAISGSDHDSALRRSRLEAQVRRALTREPFSLRHAFVAAGVASWDGAALPAKVELYTGALFEGSGRFAEAELASDAFVRPLEPRRTEDRLSNYLRKKGVSKSGVELLKERRSELARMVQSHIEPDQLDLAYASCDDRTKLPGEAYRLSGAYRVIARDRLRRAIRRDGRPAWEAQHAGAEPFEEMEWLAQLSPAERLDLAQYLLYGVAYESGTTLNPNLTAPGLWYWELQLDEAREDLRQLIVDAFRTSYPGVPERRRVHDDFLANDRHFVAIVYEWLRELWQRCHERQLLSADEVTPGELDGFLWRHLPSTDPADLRAVLQRLTEGQLDPDRLAALADHRELEACVSPDEGWRTERDCSCTLALSPAGLRGWSPAQLNELCMLYTDLGRRGFQRLVKDLKALRDRGVLLRPLLDLVAESEAQWHRETWNKEDQRAVLARLFLDQQTYLTADARLEALDVVLNSQSLGEWVEQMLKRQNVTDQLRENLLGNLYSSLWTSLGWLSEPGRQRVPWQELDRPDYESFLRWGKPDVQRGIQVVDMLPASRDDLVAIAVHEGGIAARVAAQAEASAAAETDVMRLMDAVRDVGGGSLSRDRTGGTGRPEVEDDEEPIIEDVLATYSQRERIDRLQALADRARVVESSRFAQESVGGRVRGSVYGRAKSAMAYSRRREYLNAAITAAGRGENFAKWVVRRADFRSSLAGTNSKKLVAAAHTGYPNGDQPFHLLVRVPHDAVRTDWNGRSYVLFNSSYSATSRRSWFKSYGWAGLIPKGLMALVNPRMWIDIEKDLVVGVHPFKWNVQSSGGQRGLIQDAASLGSRLYLDDTDKIPYSEVALLIASEQEFVKNTRELQTGNLRGLPQTLEDEAAAFRSDLRKEAVKRQEENRELVESRRKARDLEAKAKALEEQLEELMAEMEEEEDPDPDGQ